MSSRSSRVAPSRVGNRLYCNAAGDFAGLVATHAVGEDEQAHIAVQSNRVLIVIAHLAGIR